ncbi:MAG: aminotransferase class I/II-fold pyridoxal phosphate-dependent enzyme [Candidatus Hydrogenedentes bacterium]|nr:aminotransferase class I/II-fold pyridoxal phosphate-dependent enzyme [Candidatus Hydrogenedentota bacterium]
MLRKTHAIEGNRRMLAVQAPAIPLVADLIRDTPGTISLGQGVVGYGPPPQAIERIRDFLANPQNHKYQAVHGVPELRAQIQKKLREENCVEVGPDRALVVTAGGNMAFMNAVLAIVDPGDEVIIIANFPNLYENWKKVGKSGPHCFDPGAAIAKDQFTIMTAGWEVFPGHTWLGEGKYDFAGSDKYIEWCRANGIAFHAHGLGTGPYSVWQQIGESLEDTGND